MRAINISERKAAETTLRESEERFRRTVENAPVGIAHVTPDGRWLHVNQHLCDITGYTEVELRARTFQEITHPDDLAADLAQVRSMLAGIVDTCRSEKRYLRKDGSVIWVDRFVSCVRTAEGAVNYFISVVQDISERKRAEEAAAHLAAIVVSSFDAIVSKTLDGIVTSWNAAAERMFGYKPEEMIGQSIRRLIPPDRQDEEDRILARLRAGDRIEHYETVRLTKDGRTLDVSLTISPIRDNTGKIIGASKIIRDISERKQAEIALRELNLTLERRIEARTREIERLSEASRRAAITRERLRMARNLHDTLANSIVSLLLQVRAVRKQLAQTDPTLETELTQAEESAREALVQVRTAVAELRYQVTGGGGGLGPALERLLAQLRDRTALEIRLDVDPAAAGLEDGKAEVLYRIAQEALRNVERHSGAEHVDVSLRVDHPDGAERLTLTVADDGVGFDPGAAPSDHYGLVGMREQAELIGAELRVDSTLSRGTRVSVSIPV